MRSKPTDRQDRGISPLIVESLESRRLFAMAFDNGVLVVTGSDAEDHVLVRSNPADSAQLLINLNGVEKSFTAATLPGIRFELGGGRDFLIVTESKNASVNVPMTINGGGGNDLLFGGSGNDLITGGAGRDRIAAGAGDDMISSGGSRDLVSGGAGNDYLSGGAGPDALDAGSGDDMLIGAAGDDHLTGGEGSDTLSGGAGMDKLFGNTGIDILAGGPDNDSLDGGADPDNLNGGGGTDVFAKDDQSQDSIID